MLSKEQNELMCRVGPGTVMGATLKQYWVPAVRAARLVADGAPVRIRLFGEEYVAFRATDGRIGFFDEGCPHRGVSLGLARNGDCALTCLYHGWKIDVSGKVVDVPSEPAERKSFGNKVQVNHYPVHEAGGLIWVWLGKGEEPPPFPGFVFTQLPAENVDVRGAVTHCNWVQGLEGVWDSSHVGLLHQSWLQGAAGNISTTLSDSSPHFAIQLQPYGMQAAALRQVGEGRQYVRVTEFVMPFYTFIASGMEHLGIVIIPVPIDDTHAMQWYITYNVAKPIDKDEPLPEAGSKDLDNFYDPYFGPEVTWGQNRKKMEAGHFTGLGSIIREDFVVQESQGEIVDRSKEHLGTSDQVIIRGRRLLLEAAQMYSQGRATRGLDCKVPFDQIEAKSFILPDGVDWREPEGVELRR